MDLSITHYPRMGAGYKTTWRFTIWYVPHITQKLLDDTNKVDILYPKMSSEPPSRRVEVLPLNLGKSTHIWAFTQVHLDDEAIV
jgi:hypothetical protein